MTYPFSEIIIIYNPVSTGDSRANAQSLQQKLDKRLVHTTVSLLATKHAGHAEEIARRYAAQKDVLLVSSSGDGGYNDLVNGLLSVKDAQATVCVLPSGNANDHAVATTDTPLEERIITGKTISIDLIKLQAVQNGKTFVRYAHSYIGFGLTAYIGDKLTQADLNPVNEKWLVLRYMLKFRHVTLRLPIEGSWRRYSSVIIANIDRMSKVIQLDAAASVVDGKVELYVHRSRTRMSLIMKLLRAAVVGMDTERNIVSLSTVSKYRLKVQCDGEVTLLDKEQPITVEVMSRYLSVIAP